MSALYLKILVLVTFLEIFKCDPFSSSNESSDDDDSSEHINTYEQCKETKTPLTKWSNEFIGDLQIVKFRPGDVIQLEIQQIDVPSYFKSFEILRRAQYKRRPVTTEVLRGAQEYINCKPNLSNCIYNTNISYHYGDKSHLLQVNTTSTKLFSYKKMYLIQHPDDDPAEYNTTHKIKYRVDWKTGCDSILYKLEPSVTDARTSVPLTTTTPEPEPDVVTRKSQDSNASDKTQPSSGQNRKDTGSLDPTLIGGTVALFVMLLLLAMGIYWKCRNKKKAEPIYNEIQYAELLLNDTNRTPPQQNDATYSQIKGVLIPKQNSDQSMANGDKDKQNTDKSIANAIKDNAVYAEIQGLPQNKTSVKEGALLHNGTPKIFIIQNGVTSSEKRNRLQRAKNDGIMTDNGLKISQNDAT